MKYTFRITISGEHEDGGYLQNVTLGVEGIDFSPANHRGIVTLIRCCADDLEAAREKIAAEAEDVRTIN